MVFGRLDRQPKQRRLAAVNRGVRAVERFCPSPSSCPAFTCTARRWRTRVERVHTSPVTLLTQRLSARRRAPTVISLDVSALLLRTGPRPCHASRCAPRPPAGRAHATGPPPSRPAAEAPSLGLCARPARPRRDACGRHTLAPDSTVPPKILRAQGAGLWSPARPAVLLAAAARAPHPGARARQRGHAVRLHCRRLHCRALRRRLVCGCAALGRELERLLRAQNVACQGRLRAAHG